MGDAAQWTFLVYMAGDNNLESAGNDDLKEMQQVGSTPQVNVIVQFDTEENKTTRYRVEKGNLSVVEEMPGVDCGDPKVLTDFIGWGAKTYPAAHYLVDVWNHGGGWENLPSDFDYNSIRSAKPARARKLQRVKRSLFRTTARKIGGLDDAKRAIAIDCGSHDYLDTQELRTAVASGLPGGQKVDVLGCDACLMNMLEIAFEMKDAAGYMVGSEETEPGAGWPYADVLKDLTGTPAMTGAQLANTIAKRYGAWYQQNGVASRDGAATQSALNLGQIQTAADAVDQLGGALLKDIQKVAGGVALARNTAQHFEYPEYIDLGDFAAQLVSRLPKTSPASKAAAGVREALKVSGKGFVTQNAKWGSGVKRALGVSIYFPPAGGYSPDYATLQFSKQARWNKFLQAFFKA